jgi:hypothetical protein
MSEAHDTTTPSGQERTGLLFDYLLLGVDERGVHHVADTTTATVHAIDPDAGRLARRRYRPDHDDLGLDGYADGVAIAYGWADQRYHTGGGDLTSVTEAIDA